MVHVLKALRHYLVEMPLLKCPFELHCTPKRRRQPAVAAAAAPRQKSSARERWLNLADYQYPCTSRRISQADFARNRFLA